MRPDTIANLFFEEIQGARSVEKQIVDTLTRIASGVSVRGLSEAVARILKTTNQHVERLDRIFDEIELVHEDETICCPAIVDRMQSASERTTPRAPRIRPSNDAQLTSREVEVLRLIAEGYANKHIASDLAISVKTVEKHRQRMMRKLDLHDTAGVTRYAIASGLVEAVA